MQDLQVLISIVLHQLIAITAAVSLHSPSLEITFPAQHSWWQVSNDDGLLKQLPVHFQTHNFRVPEDGYLFVTGDRVPDGYRHTSRANSLILGGIEPGSHFWKMELRPWNESANKQDNAEGFPQVILHVEVVVDLADKRSPWKYNLQEHERRPHVLINLRFPEHHLMTNTTKSPVQVLPVCYISSTSGAFDGQKRMWLQIMEGLGGGVRNGSTRFEFAVKTFEQVVDDSPLTKALHRLNVSLQGLPLIIPREELAEDQTTSDGVADALLTSFYQQFPSARHSAQLISKLNQSDLLNLQPPFAFRVWMKLVDALRTPCHDGLIIFSNWRSISDELLVVAARLAGARAVIMELANLHPIPVDVDVLLAPSHFAQKHYSVARNVRSRHSIVLSTGVNTEVFVPSTVQDYDDQLFIIGYVGRLSSEKSLGILLAGMKILAQTCSRCRLRVIGDGPQKPWLQSIALEWGLLNINVEFVDGIYNDEEALIRQYQEMHVFASTLFTETLGLAVLEAMSVGLPVVGFISGGTGEFLEHDVNCAAVMEPTPTSFADALFGLVNDTERRLRLGKQARMTVKERFSTRSTLEQYASLYERIGRSFERDQTMEPKQEACTPYKGDFCELTV